MLAKVANLTASGIFTIHNSEAEECTQATNAFNMEELYKGLSRLGAGRQESASRLDFSLVAMLARTVGVTELILTTTSVPCGTSWNHAFHTSRRLRKPNVLLM